jgi:conjugal transfer/entry exclusion protein
MENQHRIIKGYRELSVEEIALMNEVKEAGAQLSFLVQKVEDHLNKQYEAVYDEELNCNHAESDRLEKADPYIWAIEAKKDLQVGIMKLVRAVAQPTTF